MSGGVYQVQKKAFAKRWKDGDFLYEFAKRQMESDMGGIYRIILRPLRLLHGDQLDLARARARTVNAAARRR